MTIAPIKKEMERIWNLPESLPEHLLRILIRRPERRRWEEVEILQQERWKTENPQLQKCLDKETTAAYRLRYGQGSARRDVSGHLILSQEKPWVVDEPRAEDIGSVIGWQTKKTAADFGAALIWKGLERGLNILIGKMPKIYGVPFIKVDGSWNPQNEQIMQGCYGLYSPAQVSRSVRNGILTEAMIGYDYRDMSASEKADQYDKIFEDMEESGIDDDLYGLVFDDAPEGSNPQSANDNENIEENNKKDNQDSRQGQNSGEKQLFVWHHDEQGACESCPGEGEIFAIDELPEVHPNCRCWIEAAEEEEEPIIKPVKIPKPKSQDEQPPKQKPHMKIYVKNGTVGHVRIEVVDEEGNRIIRGLNSDYWHLEPVLEKGELDSSGLSIDDKAAYTSSEEIELSDQQLEAVKEYLNDKDKSEVKYNMLDANCVDYVNNVLKAAGVEGSMGDYLSEEQVEKIKISQLYDTLRDNVPYFSKFIQFQKEFGTANSAYGIAKEILR